MPSLQRMWGGGVRVGKKVETCKNLSRYLDTSRLCVAVVPPAESEMWLLLGTFHKWTLLKMMFICVNSLVSLLLIKGQPFSVSWKRKCVGRWWISWAGGGLARQQIYFDLPGSHTYHSGSLTVDMGEVLQTQCWRRASKGKTTWGRRTPPCARKPPAPSKRGGATMWRLKARLFQQVLIELLSSGKKGRRKFYSTQESPCLSRWWWTWCW